MTVPEVFGARPAEEWTPFMAALRAEMAHRRSRRRLRGVTLSVLVALFLFSAFWIARKGPSNPVLLAASVPTAHDPLFASEFGKLERLTGGEWVVRGGAP